mgnify:CR=1 FL=1
MPELYPISLSANFAFDLMQKHLQTKYDKAISSLWAGDRTVLDHIGYLHEDGSVMLTLWHSSDGFGIMSSGALFRETIRPFNEEEIARIVLREQYRQAEKELDRREDQARQAKIEKIRQQLFEEKADVQK